jgi:hypothetical protein
MNIRAVRWLSVPIAVLVGYYAAVWLFLEGSLACFHLGSRPPGLCTDWWYGNHSRVAALISGIVLFVSGVLLPVFLAPRHGRLVAVMGLAVALLMAAFTFDRWVLAWAVPTMVVLAITGVRAAQLNR